MKFTFYILTITLALILVSCGPNRNRGQELAHKKVEEVNRALPGNKWYENLDYVMGGLANVQDAFAGFNGGDIDLKARKKLAGHSWMAGEDIIISVGPGGATDKFPNADGLKWETQYLFKTAKGRSFITSYTPGEELSTRLYNVRISSLQSMTRNLDKGLSLTGLSSLRYSVWNGCVNQTSRALFLSGVLNVNAFLPITTPVLLNAEMAIRNYAMMFSYTLLYK